MCFLPMQTYIFANRSSITGDTKAGTLIGTDRWGNKYFENLEEELPRKTNHNR